MHSKTGKRISKLSALREGILSVQEVRSFFSFCKNLVDVSCELAHATVPCAMVAHPHSPSDALSDATYPYDYYSARHHTVPDHELTVKTSLSLSVCRMVCSAPGVLAPRPVSSKYFMNAWLSVGADSIASDPG